MMAKGLSALSNISQLFTHIPTLNLNLHRRSPGGHYATRFLDEDGDFLNQMDMVNSSVDVSPTASQMPRLLGLAQASKVYKAQPELAAAFSGSQRTEMK